MTIRGGYWIIVEIHFEKPKMPDCTVHCADRPNIWPVCPAVQYSTVQYSTAQYMACLPCSTNNIFHRRSPGSTLVSCARKELRVVWVWFLDSSRVDTIIIVMWRITREMCPSCPRSQCSVLPSVMGCKCWRGWPSCCSLQQAGGGI